MSRIMSIAAALAVVALAGCNSVSESPSSLTPENQFYRVAATYSTILSSRVYHDNDPEGVTPRCSNPGCTSGNSRLDTTIAIRPLYFAGDMLDSGLGRASEVGDLPIFKWSVDKNFGSNSHVSITNYGAWLDHSAFVVSTQRFDVSPGSHQAAFGASWGRRSQDQSFPLEGKAQWNGAMLAIDPTSEEVFAGEAGASISFSSAGPTMRIGFTEIAGIESGARRDDIEFPTVDVTKERFVSWEGDDFFASKHRVNGRFFGPNFAEIGGVFDSDGLAGSFGGRKAK